MSEIERCQSCTRVYEIREMHMAMPGTKEPEEIFCPYCSHYYTRMCNGVWTTHKVSKETEDPYNLDHPIKE